MSITLGQSLLGDKFVWVVGGWWVGGLEGSVCPAWKYLSVLESELPGYP